jgi:hypothetical protein
MIVKLIYCLARNPNLTPEQFQEYWRNIHAPKVASVRHLLGMIRYVQNHAFEHAMSGALRESRGGKPPFDGVMEGWIDTEAGKRNATSEEYLEAARMLLDDEAKFIDFERSIVFVTHEHVIFE